MKRQFLFAMQCILCTKRKRKIVHFFLSGIYNPYEFEPPPSGGSEITHKDAPQSVGLLWMSDQPVADLYLTIHTALSTDNHPCPRRDSNPQTQQAIGRRHAPRPLGHWDRQEPSIYMYYSGVQIFSRNIKASSKF